MIKLVTVEVVKLVTIMVVKLDTVLWRLCWSLCVVVMLVAVL